MCVKVGLELIYESTGWYNWRHTSYHQNTQERNLVDSIYGNDHIDRAKARRYPEALFVPVSLTSTAAIFLHQRFPYRTLSDMDFQNRAGGKTGSGGVASWSESNRDRRERLRQLALETIDLNKVNIFHSLRRWFTMCARACFNSRAWPTIGLARVY